MTPAEAVERCNVLLAHLWMVRTFLKHSDEVEEDAELNEISTGRFPCVLET